MHDKILLKDCSDLSRRIDTDRFGPFVFQPGCTLSAVDLALHRVEDAHARFVASPLSQVANRLEQEVLVSSVFGTNTIEGGTLSEEETASALILDPRQVQAVEQQRALNIKAAYDLSQAAAKTPGWSLTTEFIVDLHRLITADIPHEDNRPGLIRDNPKTRVTYVGDAAHGGRYKPPQYGKDIERLLSALIAWHGELEAAGVPALIRAPLVHLYYEQIHPFWDGNGRVGRVIEATLLQAAGYRYAPFALARYYLQNIDAYFTLFNTCRKAAEKGRGRPQSRPSSTFTSKGCARPSIRCMIASIYWSAGCSTRAGSAAPSTISRSTPGNTPFFPCCLIAGDRCHSTKCGTRPGTPASI
jgi:fido (protein-threonine AMPylation protein)